MSSRDPEDQGKSLRDHRQGSSDELVLGCAHVGEYERAAEVKECRQSVEVHSTWTDTYRCDTKVDRVPQELSDFQQASDQSEQG